MRQETCCRHMGYSFLLTASFFLMHHPTGRIAHTTAFVTPVVEHWLEWEIAQWVHPMKDRSNDPPWANALTTELPSTDVMKLINEWSVHAVQLNVVPAKCLIWSSTAWPGRTWQLVLWRAGMDQPAQQGETFLV